MGTAQGALSGATRLAERLPPVLAEARKVAGSVAHGTHGRRRAGPGDDFWQFRRQGEGDTITDIDWRQSAKSTELFVRDKEWEIAQTVWLWCDTSPSMDWSGHKNRPPKLTAALVIALALADRLLAAGERVGILGGAERPLSGAHMLERVAFAMDGAWRNGNPSLPPEESRVRPHSRVVLISDFLESHWDLENRLRRLASVGARGHVLQVLDPDEEALPYRGRVEFEGLEGEGRIEFGKVQNVVDAYRAAFEQRQSELRELARNLGWSLLVHHTDKPPHASLLALAQRVSGARAGGRG